MKLLMFFDSIALRAVYAQSIRGQDRCVISQEASFIRR